MTATAASRLVQQLAYHPHNIAIAAETMRAKGLSVSEYYTIIESKTPLTLLGSTLHQSPVTKTVLQISSMLSASAVPIALFGTVTQPKHAPERFRAILEEIRGKFEVETQNDG